MAYLRHLSHDLKVPRSNLDKELTFIELITSLHVGSLCAASMYNFLGVWEINQQLISW